MAARESVSATHDNVTTDEITTEQDLFYAAVKQEVKIEESGQHAFTSVRVKEELVDYDEMSTQDDAVSRKVDTVLPPMEEVFVDPPPMKTEPNIDDPWRFPQLDNLHQIDPLLLPQDVKQEEKTEVPSSGTVATQGQKVTGSSIRHGPKVTLYTNAKGQKDTGVACSECGMVFATKKRLKQHSLSHSGEKLHKCSECYFHTAYPSVLARHERTHTGDKPYACTECDYRTAVSSALAKHKRTHTGEKPYFCTECDYRAGDSSALTSHKRTHTGEKPYACAECDYRTAVSSALAKHKRTHTGEKPYFCTECDYRTADSSALASHKRSHTGEKPYACNKCDYCTAYSRALATHKRGQHQ